MESQCLTRVSCPLNPTFTTFDELKARLRRERLSNGLNESRNCRIYIFSTLEVVQLILTRKRGTTMIIWYEMWDWLNMYSIFPGSAGTCFSICISNSHQHTHLIGAHK
jgi:hypothetical protein